jgi:hypothetical protein
MTVIRLSDGGLVLHSPVRLDDEIRQELDRLGPVTALVAPNRVHHLFLGDYVRAFPRGRLYGAPGLAEKRKELKFDAILDDSSPSEWAGQIEQHLFRGAPYISEVVFFHRPTRTLMVTDLVFNIKAEKTAGARFFCWVTGAAGRFGPHRLIRLMIRDKVQAAKSVETIMRWNFDRVIMTHGDVLERGGREKFAAAFAYLK